MNRRIFLFALPLFLAAFVAAPAGEPGPGLEIIDGDAPIPSTPTYDYPPPAPSPTYTPDASIQNGPLLSEPYAIDPMTSQPIPFTAPPAPLQPDPFAAPATTSQPDPFAAPTATEGAAPADQPQGGMTYESPEAVIASLNGKNKDYPGLDGAAAQGNLRLCADIVLQTLRQRRIVNAALAKGPGGSIGTPSPHEAPFLADMINNANLNPGPPIQATRRIDIILDTFNQPILDDYNYAYMMDRILLRLHADLTAVRMALANPPPDVIYHELARAYFRVVTECDFFLFYRKDVVSDFNNVMASAHTMFYPDGASVGGDVGGISGTAFHDLIMMDRYSFGDEGFRREVSSGWRILDRPARFLLGVMLPDMTLPRYGPRGERELTPVDMAKLKAIFADPEQKRFGLGVSHSYPPRSGQASYGGIFASRSDPEAGARYLSVRYGPWGQLPGAPAHNDFGSLVVASRNVTFIADPGGFGGPAAEAAAHSVLSLGNAFAEPTSYNTPAAPVDSVWRTNAAIDYAADAVAFPDGKRWQRDVVYVKGLPGEGGADYWVLLDRVEMNGDNNPRQARIRFQLAPGVQAYHDGSGMLVTPSFGMGSALRIFAIDRNSQLTLADGDMGVMPSFVYDNAGAARPAPSVVLERTLVGDSTTATILYPGEDQSVRPARIERDSDIIRGRTGAIVIDHGMDKVDVIAWAPPGSELITPTLSLNLSADVAVFRLRKGKIVRAAFVNLERFQAKEPDGGEWSMRVNGPPATLYLEPERYGGWQVLSDPANAKTVWLEKVNLGPAMTDRRMRIAPGEIGVFNR